MKTDAYLRIGNDNEENFEYSRKPMIFSPGIWLNGKVYWLGNVTEKLLPQEDLSIKIKQADVHSRVEFFNLYVTNHSKVSKEAKLILMQRMLIVLMNNSALYHPMKMSSFTLQIKESTS